MAQQKVTFKINKKYKPNHRKAIAQEVVDFIVDRTLKGKDKNNVKFAKYSDAYKKSLDFKIAGKSAGKVNLKLSGDMLTSLKVLNTNRAGSVTIGFDADDPDNEKAEGNIKGTYGNKKQVGPKRDFLGIKKTDLDNKVLSKFPLEDPTGLAAQILIALRAEKESEGTGDEL